MSTSGALLDECVLHLPAEQLSDETCGELERRWALLRQVFRSSGALGASGHFPELVLPGEGEPGMLPPVVYCAVPKAFFELPCPECLQPLDTCRDDGLLAQLGLPLYSTSSSRFLICPRCVKDGKPTHAVSADLSQSSSDAKFRVLGPPEYFEGVARALAKAKKSKGTSRFCCLGCPEREQCWVWSAENDKGLELSGLEIANSASQGPRWRVLSSHTVPFLLTRPVMQPLESFIRTLGSEKARSTAAGEEQAALLFAYDCSGLDVVEILILRLTAFGQAVRAVREHYRVFGRPHLDINSESVLVARGSPAFGLPTLWSFRVILEATSAVDTLDLGQSATVILPPREPVAPFFSSTLRDFLLTGSRAGELKIDRLTEDGDRLWRIEGQLVDPRGVFPKPDVRDWIRLEWAEDPCGLGVTQAAARAVRGSGVKEGRSKVVVTTEPLELDTTAVEKIRRAGGAVLPQVNYRVYPHLDAVDDLYSLGMVLFLCTLVNDVQDLGLVMDDLELLALRRSGGEDLKARARDHMAHHPETWGPSAVLFDAADRRADRPNAVPDDLWVDVLTLGLRMVAGARDLVQEDEAGAVVFGRVEEEIQRILKCLKALVFERQPLHLEIQSIISELLGEEIKQT
jgi:hypothetical protein